jgi:hypothetical protein
VLYFRYRRFYRVFTIMEPLFSIEPEKIPTPPLEDPPLPEPSEPNPYNDPEPYPIKTPEPSGD